MHMNIHVVHVEALNSVTSRCIPAINRLIKQRGRLVMLSVT